MAATVTTDHVREVSTGTTESTSGSAEMAMNTESGSDNATKGDFETQEVSCNTLSSQLAGTLKFANKNGHAISAFPIIVDFRRLIQLSNNSANGNSIIPGATNQELLHAVVGLYDVSLSEMTADVLYASVCDKWAKTILLIQDLKETVKALDDRKHKQKEKEPEQTEACSAAEDEISKTAGEEPADNGAAQEDVFEPEESPESLFTEVFSDTESEEEEEEESDEEDFSKGIHSFIKSSSERRKNRTNSACIKPEHVGIENRLVGCVTFEKKYINHTVKVVHLTLLTVRRRFRKYGIGRYMMRQVLDPSVAGPYDAVVVHADNGALNFFERCGFSDDVVLNSRWSELAEQFTNCTLMCYLPGFSGAAFPPDLTEKCQSLTELDKEMKHWKEKSLEAYQAQVSCHMRLRQEILQLHNLAQSQKAFIDELTLQNNRLYHDKMNLGQDLQESRLETVMSSVKGPRQYVSADTTGEEGEDVDTHDVMRELERRVEMIDMMRRSRQSNPLLDSEGLCYRAAEEAYVRSQVEPYDHTQDAAEFYSITDQFKVKMAADKTLAESYEVSMIDKACLSRKAESGFWLCLATLVDPSCTEQLYFCGSLDSPGRLQAILTDGFSQADFSQGNFGHGIYFSRYPSTAAKFSTKGQLILADVAVGKQEVISEGKPSLMSAGPGFDSVVCPGRLSASPASTNPVHEEVVIFNPAQARPLCVISYEPVKKSS